MSAAVQPHLLQLVDFDQVQQMIRAAIEPLERKLKLVEASQSEWVDTKEAMRLTGIRCADTLKAEREREHTALIVKFEGRTGKIPKYLRSSLLAHSETKTYRHRGRRAA